MEFLFFLKKHLLTAMDGSLASGDSGSIRLKQVSCLKALHCLLKGVPVLW